MQKQQNKVPFLIVLSSAAVFKINIFRNDLSGIPSECQTD